MLNAINPHYIRSRPYRPLPGTPMYEEYGQGDFHLPDPHEQLREMKLTMERLHVTSRVCFDHAGNYWRGPNGGILLSHDYEGYGFPEQKAEVLALIEKGLRVKHRIPEFLRL